MGANSKRDNTIDLACGILIIRMVLKHALQSAQVTHFDFYEWMNVFFFIMPWFFFKAGMFYKEKSTHEIVSSGYKHLIVPLLTMTLLGHMILCISYAIKGGHNAWDYLVEPFWELIRFGSTQGNLALWFLLSLFLVRIAYHQLYQYFQPITMLFIAMTGSLLVLHLPIIEPYYLFSTMTGLFFFMMGHLLKEWQYNKYVFAVSMLLYLVHMCFIPSFVDMRTCRLLEGYYEVWMVGAIAGCITLNGACKWGIQYGEKLTRHIPNLRYLSFIPGFIMTIGRNSLTIYLFHWIFLMSFSLLFYDLPYFHGKHRWEFFTLSGLFTIVGLYLVYKYRNSKVIKFLTR